MSTEDARASLLVHYDAADADTRRRGRTWYAEARRECRKIARETGFSYRRVAAVMAITSADARLITNIAWTRQACERRGIASGGRYPAQQRPKVWRALYGRNPSAAVSGPKVTAFYRAIVGDNDVLVIDRWASFAAGGPRDRVPNASQRRSIAEAYADTAQACGESLRDFQAIVWIQCRESTPDVRGTIRQYADITA
jgi:hypothetical protein